jgi:hypothetical protein
MHYDSEGDVDDAASSRGSWYDVSTPLPSPPPTPPQLSEDELSSDEDGYCNIDAEDHREYDRWFAEDRMDELDEMGKCACSNLSLNVLKFLSYRADYRGGDGQH